VNALPVIAVVSSTTEICDGGSATVTASGANTYTWNGSANIATLVVSPSVTTTYSVIGTSTDGCVSSNTAAVTLTVHPKPVVGATSNTNAVCDGDAVTFSGTGANTYTWTGGPVNNVPFVPAATGSYTVSGTSTAGCTSTN